MGTRGAIAFVVDGVEKISYNHFDSYPDGLGLTMLEWLQSAAKDPAGLRKQAQDLRMVSEDAEPTPEEIAAFYDRYGWSATAHGGTADLRENQKWYDLLHELQGKPGEILRAGISPDAASFPLDSLFCEWAYVVDLDGDGQFEVYEGFQHSPHDKGRFADRPETVHGTVGSYYPVALVASWPLAQLPDKDEFLRAMPGEE